jgi:23S rRNA (cytidine1920-2'-O)/16S rRNA (cytidine1409-2'-O)-methyltransferase
MIDAGDVHVNGRIISRPGHKVFETSDIEVRSLKRWVARSAEKLLAACETFDIEYRGRFVLDVGASTGGFTEVALSRGASKVIALDVGHGQLHPRIRGDYRVVVREGVNARSLTGEEFAEWDVDRIDDVVVDVSFISLTLIVSSLVTLLGPSFRYVFLIKPQFEVGKGNLVEGIVRDVDKRRAAVADVCRAIEASGLTISGVVESVIDGERGNREVIVYGNPDNPLNVGEWEQRVATMWEE